MSLPAWVVPLLRCPACRGGLFRPDGDACRCQQCGWQFTTAGTPVLAPRGPVPPLELRNRRTLAQTEDHIRLIERRGWVGDPMIDALPGGTVVLSVGEGFGEMILRLAKRRSDCFFLGIDLTADYIEKAIQLANAHGLRNVWLCVADATNLPFADRSFEVGYTRGVLHILPDPVLALNELRRVLRSRLLVDRLANRPFFALWFWLLQRYEHVRAIVQGRRADEGIWRSVAETLESGTYWPLWRYRRWFRDDRDVRVRATSLLIWERPRHWPVIGWLGVGGAIDVRF